MSLNSGRGIETVEAHTANYTVVADVDTGKVFTNLGATGAVTFALPPATVGERFKFSVLAAQALNIDPNGTETISLATGVQGAAGKYLGYATIGGLFSIVCVKAGQWNCFDSIGTWVSEA